MFGCIPTQQPAYAQYAQAGAWPVAERVGANGFYVGCHQYLTDDDIDEMAKTIVDVVKGAGQ
jgi:CDP-6-deoxy-D-xylo-4-hexulose-3-dehydrase